MTHKMKYGLPEQCQVLLISFHFILIKVSRPLFKYYSYSTDAWPRFAIFLFAGGARTFQFSNP